MKTGVNGSMNERKVMPFGRILIFFYCLNIILNKNGASKFEAPFWFSVC